jgi:hypothetical protein
MDLLSRLITGEDQSGPRVRGSSTSLGMTKRDVAIASTPTHNNRFANHRQRQLVLKELNEEIQDQAEPPKIGDANHAIVCPVCGAATTQEKCKVICKSDLCRGRVVYNCAEF